ncbi:MAG: GxxExxY protein [Pyrinomonadaceae bacterium]|nr:GxxExxY protein [Pyrinomonadaceae bacterium]
MAELVLKKEVYEIIGAAMEVYYQLGRGFLEPIYQEAFEIELGRRGLPFEQKKELTVLYKGHQLEKKYVPDLICFSQIVVELKALERLTPVEEAQLLNYLKMTRMGVGLLINFGSRVKLEWKKYVI